MTSISIHFYVRSQPENDTSTPKFFYHFITQHDGNFHKIGTKIRQQKNNVATP